METEMHVDGNIIRIETAVPLSARLFGLPFLAMGAYVAYNLAMSIAGVMQGTGTVSEMIGGQLILTVFMLSFGVPGAALVFGRRNVVIDRGKRSIGELRGIGFVKLRTMTVPLDVVTLVRATLRLSTSFKIPGQAEGSQVTPSYEVELIDGKGIKAMLAGLFSRPADAVAFAKKLARAMGLPFEDQTARDPGMAEGEGVAG